MKKFFAALSILIACLGFTANSFADDHTSKSNVIEYLYIQSAKLAVLEPTSASDSYTLTLKNVHPYVVCFSERPNRIINTLSVKKFINEWLHPTSTTKNNFLEDAPNADLNGVKVAGQDPVNIPVELSNPQYNDHDKTLTYKVTQLKGGQKLSAMQLHDATLIIDDYCTDCF
jgi:hypothetical protein